MSVNRPIVVLDYNELEAGIDVSSKIAEAFGIDGLGLLTGMISFSKISQIC